MQADFEKRLERIQARKAKDTPEPALKAAPQASQIHEKHAVTTVSGWVNFLYTILTGSIVKRMNQAFVGVAILIGIFSFTNLSNVAGWQPGIIMDGERMSLSDLVPEDHDSFSSALASNAKMSLILYRLENGKITREEAMEQWIAAGLEPPREYAQYRANLQRSAAQSN